jgi:hypothetical protein
MCDSPKTPRVETVIEDFPGPVISSYTRQQALADGALVDVSEMAWEAGFRFPVALTRAAWNDCVQWSEEDSQRQIHQNLSGRLWDVLWMAWVKVRVSPKAGAVLHYALLRIPRDGAATEAVKTELKIVLSNGDDGDPVLTILLPNED